MKLIWVFITIFAAGTTQANNFIVTLSPGVSPIQHFGKVEKLFPSSGSDYFRRTVLVKSSVNQLRSLQKQGVVLSWEKDLQVNSLAISAESAQAFTQDPYSRFQWGLLNQQQRFSYDVTDLIQKNLVGSPGSDIAWEAPTNPPVKAVLVAVLDSGVDTEHPDLRNQIFRNSKECDSQGKPRLTTKEDLDQNGYAGDCVGWNFVNNNNNVFDKDGHGTHVSGIIAASIQNGIGIAGVAPHAQILPVRVLAYGETSAAAVYGFVSKVAQGLVYAVEQNAQVINLSLGWPLGLDSPTIKKALDLAHQRGVIVVAAAGNNGSFRPVFPCSHKSVICVGALSPDGQRDDFSNYGSHVDVLAPGRQILSLNPVHLTPLHWPVKGYEVRSGTSQAAPHVAGVVARVLEKFPAAKLAEISSRLVLAAKPIANSQTLAGLVDLRKSLSILPQVNLQVSHKNLPLSRVVGDTLSVRASLDNLWLPAQNVQIQVKSSPDLALLQDQFSLGSLSSNESREIHLSARILNPNLENEQSFQISIQAEGYQTQSALKVTLVSSSPTQKFQSRLSVDGAQLQSITGGNPSSPQYYFWAPKTSSAPATLYFFGASGNEGSLVLPDVQSVLQVLRLPHFFVVVSVVQTGEKKSFQFTYLNENFLCASEPCHWKWSPRKVSWNPNNVAWIRSQQGPPLLPYFIAQGLTPPEDFIPDPWGDNPETMSWRIYFLEVANGELRERQRDLGSFYANLEKQLQVKFYQNPVLRRQIVQSEQDVVAGKFSTLLAVEGSNPQKHVWVEVSPQSEVISRQLTFPISTASSTPIKVHALDSTSKRSLLAVRSNPYRISVLDADNGNFLADLSQKNLNDPMVEVKAAILKNGKTWYVVESRHNLLIFDELGNVQDELLVHRSTFLPGAVFSDMFFPLVLGKDGAREFGFLVDSTILYYRQFGLIRLDLTGSKARFATQTKDSFELEGGCRILNPVQLHGETHLAQQCSDESGSHIEWFVP